MENLVIWAPIMGILALAFAYMLAARITRSPAGNQRMQEISDAIHEGAMAFLFREYKILSAFVAIMFIVIGLFIDWPTSISYLMGSIASVLAGFIGMNVATRSNVDSPCGSGEPEQGSQHSLFRWSGHGNVGGGFRPFRTWDSLFFIWKSPRCQEF